MDYFINIVVKLFVFLSRFVSIFSKFNFINYKSMDDLKIDPKLYILLVGYNGTRNTGSDIRTAEIAKQLQERLGKDHVRISVMALDEDNIRCYFDADVQFIHFNSIFFIDVFKACCTNQAVILCEGSTLKSKFANALTLYFCEAAGIAKNQHKPCIAYGSEAGEMDRFLKHTVKKLCKETYFVARTQNSLDQIHKLGLNGHLGTDAAWKFNSVSHIPWADAKLRQSGWDGKSPLLGVAPINPFWWPVKPSLIKWIISIIHGDHSLQFQLCYFFSWSKSRKQKYNHYLNAIARSVNTFAESHPCHVVILGMEQLDTDACNQLASKLNMPTSVFLSADHNGYEMASIIRQLSMLITSRYHAEILSMEANIPSVAISMDERLDNIMRDMNMEQYQLLHTDDIDLFHKLSYAIEYIQSHQKPIKDTIKYHFMKYQNMFDDMENFLISWLLSQCNSDSEIYRMNHKF